jgi:4,5-dihydroxyphthalate decarboxylase
MTRLALSLAIGDYDRVRPILDGAVRIDGIDPVVLTLTPEEIFFRAFRHAEFDICEMSLSTYAMKLAQGNCPYVGVPVFPSRAFRHSSIYIRTDRGIATPADLRGRRIGVGEYQLTANVWARALLSDDHGIDPAEITWVRGGQEVPGRVEKVPFTPPGGLRIEAIGPADTLSALLAKGEIDGLIGPRVPSCYGALNHVGRLFPRPREASADYYRRTQIFPIMHVLGVRRDVVAAQGWVPGALLKAFSEAKVACLARLADTSAAKVTLPFVEDMLEEAQALLGTDFWSYGFEPNRHVLDSFLSHHHAQGLSARRLKAEELFHPATLEMAIL